MKKSAAKNSPLLQQNLQSSSCDTEAAHILIRISLYIAHIEKATKIDAEDDNDSIAVDSAEADAFPSRQIDPLLQTESRHGRQAIRTFSSAFARSIPSPGRLMDATSRHSGPTVTSDMMALNTTRLKLK